MNITYYCPNNYSKSIDVLYDHCHLSHNDFFQSKYIRQLQNLNAKTYAIFNQLRTVLQTLKRNNIQIISSEQQSSFDKCIVLLNDSLAIKAARQIPNFYQSHVVENVLNKSKLSAFLKDNTKLKTLNTHSITNLSDIDMTNFIIKPAEGSGGMDMGSGFNSVKMGKYGVNFNQRNKTIPLPFFAYEKFATKDQLLEKCSPSDIEQLLTDQYIIQEAVVGNAFYISIAGVANGNGDVLFARDMTRLCEECYPYKPIKFETSYSKEYNIEKNAIRQFVKDLGIKNCHIGISFLSNNGVLCPIDWCFRTEQIFKYYQHAVGEKRFESRIQNDSDADMLIRHMYDLG
jgi:hypothetical protein